MTLNNFADIITLTKQRCNIAEVTDFDDIISTAINNIYIELKKKDPTITTDTITSADKMVELPENLDSIIKIDPFLYADEYRKGKYLILEREDPTDFTITYTAIPDPLSGTVVPEINRKYWYAMSTYGCYAYYLFKKKENEAQSYLQAYYAQVDQADPQDQVQHQIQNVYDIFLR